MASPLPSPAMIASNAIQYSPLLHHHPRSQTPPAPAPPPISKRDKRRLNLADRLGEVNSSFVQNSEFHYRQQLQALQIDMSLITRADAYAEHPLADSSSDVIELVGSAIASNHGGGGGNPALLGVKRTEGDISPMSGVWLSRFMEEVNNAIEQRDTQLTQLENRHEHTLHGLHMVSRYKIRLAQEEHKVLSQSLKDRLIHAIVLRKARLLKEKEALDIADRNALLLNSNQFTMMNPSSPGGGGGAAAAGTLNNRKTRNTRHRPAEVEEMGSGIEAGHKRKRKVAAAAAAADEIGSPGPSSTNQDITTSPQKSRNAKQSAAQFEAPLYSIDRLFSEKELSMQMAIANQGAIQYFEAIEARKLTEEREKQEKREKKKARVRAKRDAKYMEKNGSPAANDNNELITTTTEPTPINGDADIITTTTTTTAESTIFPSAPDLDRLANPSHHATRNSTRNNNGIATALNVLGDLAASENVINIPLILPTVVGTGGAGGGKEKIHGLGPASLKDEEIVEEFNRIRSLINEGAGAFDRKVVDDLCAPLSMSAYQDDLLPTIGAGKEGSNAMEMLLEEEGEGDDDDESTVDVDGRSQEAEDEGEEEENAPALALAPAGTTTRATSRSVSSSRGVGGGGTKRSASRAGFAAVQREEDTKRARRGGV